MRIITIVADFWQLENTILAAGHAHLHLHLSIVSMAHFQNNVSFHQDISPCRSMLHPPLDCYGVCRVTYSQKNNFQEQWQIVMTCGLTPKRDGLDQTQIRITGVQVALTWCLEKSRLHSFSVSVPHVIAAFFDK